MTPTEQALSAFGRHMTINQICIAANIEKPEVTDNLRTLSDAGRIDVITAPKSNRRYLSTQSATSRSTCSTSHSSSSSNSSDPPLHRYPLPQTASKSLRLPKRNRNVFRTVR